MPIIVEDEKQEPAEWLLVGDKDSIVIKASMDATEIIELAKLIRKADGQVTVFKSTKY